MPDFELVTIDNWKEYSDNFFSHNFIGYIDATEQMLPLLDKILEASKDFKEMKFELTKLIQERTKFVNYANDHLP